jgi:gas vesicle protein
MTDKTASKVVGATLVGGMIGAGLAMLFAPRSGKETRDMIHDNYDDMKQQASDKFAQAKSRVQDGVDSAKDLKDRIQNGAEKTGKKAKQEMKEISNETRRRGRKQSSVLNAWEEEV